jgi:hypothetical protein
MLGDDSVLHGFNNLEKPDSTIDLTNLYLIKNI